MIQDIGASISCIMCANATTHTHCDQLLFQICYFVFHPYILCSLFVLLLTIACCFVSLRHFLFRLPYSISSWLITHKEVTMTNNVCMCSQKVLERKTKNTVVWWPTVSLLIHDVFINIVSCTDLFISFSICHCYHYCWKEWCYFVVLFFCSVNANLIIAFL